MADPRRPSSKPDPNPAPQPDKLDLARSAKAASQDLFGAFKEVVRDVGDYMVKQGEALQKIGDEPPIDGSGTGTGIQPGSSMNSLNASSAGDGGRGLPGPQAPGPATAKDQPTPPKAVPPIIITTHKPTSPPPVSPPPVHPPPMIVRESDARPTSPNPAPDPVSIKPVVSPPKPGASWQWLEIKDAVEQHDLQHWTSSTSLDGKFQVVAARVRGVSHKHEGLNCDDWFEVQQAGDWTLIAVGDGAGSARFSRVASRTACQAAIKRLVDELTGHHLSPRAVWTPETFRRDESTASFGEADLEKTQRAIHQAFADAVDAVEAAVREREASPEHIQLLGRPPDARDFKTTLLLAVHTCVPYKGKDYSLVLACQIGDGLVAATSMDWNVRVLSHADHGEFGAETKFLGRGPDIDPVALARRTFPLFEPIRSLFVMTDGVADIYFPPETQVLRLQGDLVANKVIPLPRFEADEENRVINEALTQIGAPSLEELGDYFKTAPSIRMNAVSPNGPRELRLPLVAPFAARLGKEVRDVLASPGLSTAATKLPRDLDKTEPADTRLLNFLEVLEVRGQRDDRTLVVLHPAAPPAFDGGAQRP